MPPSLAMTLLSSTATHRQVGLPALLAFLRKKDLVIHDPAEKTEKGLNLFGAFLLAIGDLHLLSSQELAAAKEIGHLLLNAGVKGDPARLMTPQERKLAAPESPISPAQLDEWASQPPKQARSRIEATQVDINTICTDGQSVGMHLVRAFSQAQNEVSTRRLLGLANILVARATNPSAKDASGFDFIVCAHMAMAIETRTQATQKAYGELTRTLEAALDAAPPQDAWSGALARVSAWALGQEGPTPGWLAPLLCPSAIWLRHHSGKQPSDPAVTDAIWDVLCVLLERSPSPYPHAAMELLKTLCETLPALPIPTRDPSRAWPLVLFHATRLSPLALDKHTIISINHDGEMLCRQLLAKQVPVPAWFPYHEEVSRKLAQTVLAPFMAECQKLWMEEGLPAMPPKQRRPRM